MDNNDDIQSFLNEPNKPEEIDPIIPDFDKPFSSSESDSVVDHHYDDEPQQKYKNQITENSNITSNTNEDDYDEDEGTLSPEEIEQKIKESESKLDTEQDQFNQETNNKSNNNNELYESQSVKQSREIQNSEPSKKTDLSDIRKNEGKKLNRPKLLVLIISIFCIFILFFSFVFPKIKNAKKKEKQKETQKNGKTYIPDNVKNWKEDNNIDFSNSNSAIQVQENQKKESSNNKKDNFDEKFSDPNEPVQNVAPVQIPKNNGNGTSDYPVTNRNEQQKNIQRLSFSEKDNEPNITSNSKYSSNYPAGYGNYLNSNNNYQSSGYTPSSLTANMDKYLNTIEKQSSYLNQSSYTTQNNQSGKNQFLEKGGIGGNYQWNSNYSLWKGTIVSAVLDTGINTDLPGQVMAHVTKNIYSSQDGKYLLIPEGSRLFGEYNSDLSYGQNRVQVVWNTLIRTDGLEINLGSMNGIDAYGHSGYKGWKTDHPFEYVKAFGLIAMYSILDTKMGNLMNNQDNKYVENVMADVYSEAKKLNNKIVDRAMDIQPTNRIPVGKEIALITNVTIDLPPMENIEVEEKYVRYN